MPRRHVLTSRLGERGTPRVMHGAIATAREEGGRKCHWMSASCIPGCTPGTLGTWSHIKTAVSLWGVCAIAIYRWKNCHLTPKFTYPTPLGVGLASVWLWSLGFFLYTVYTNIPYCFYCISETFFHQHKPLDLYCRWCLQHSYISVSPALKDSIPTWIETWKSEPLSYIKCCLKFWKRPWNWLKKKQWIRGVFFFSQVFILWWLSLKNTYRFEKFGFVCNFPNFFKVFV